jgi:hypothetical protein
VLDATDVAPDHLLDGRSLIDPTMNRGRMLTEHWRLGDPNWASMTSPSYHYTEYYRGQDDGFLEYYRFPDDPGEITNLFGDGDPLIPPPSETTPIASDLDAARVCAGNDCP